MSDLPEIIASIEQDIDSTHISNPLMRITKGEAVIKLLMHSENIARKAMAQLPDRSVENVLEVSTRLTASFDQCIDWILAPDREPLPEEGVAVTSTDIDKILELGFLYTHISSLFTSWHRGLATDVQVRGQDKYIHFTIPSYLLQYHKSALRFHQVNTPAELANSLRTARSQLLEFFKRDPASVLPTKEFNTAFELMYETTSADWAVEWNGDLGGFTMKQARRVAVALRLWSELWVFHGDGIPITAPQTLVNLLHRYSGVQHTAVQSIVSDMTFTESGKGLSSSSFVFLPIPEKPFVTWSPVKVFLMDQQRELMRRLAKTRPEIHNSLSDAKHESLLARITGCLRSYSERIIIVESLKLKNTDIDLLMIDRENCTYVCAELKAVMTPRTVREALDIDARYSSRGNLIDGLQKGVVIQVPRALQFARDNPEAFLEQVRSKTQDQSLPLPKKVWGCVITPWTLGTGAADLISTPDELDNRVRLINVPILERGLAAVRGNLNELQYHLNKDEHLVKLTTSGSDVRYGEYTIAWHAI